MSGLLRMRPASGRTIARTLPIAMLMTVACSGQGVDDLPVGASTAGSGEVSDPGIATSTSELLAAEPVTYWLSGPVRVCFKHLTGRNAASLLAAERFEQAVRGTWGTVTALEFEFFEDCSSFTPGGDDYLEVELRRHGSWVGFGGFGIGVGSPNAGFVSFCDPALSPPGLGRRDGCGPHAEEQSRSVAVHEVGHALGFLHAHQHPSAPAVLNTNCPWINPPPMGVEPPSGPGTETGAECDRDGNTDDDGDGLVNRDDPDCALMWAWITWHWNNGIVGRDYRNPYSGQIYRRSGTPLSHFDIESSITYCPESDGILDYNGDGVIEEGADAELADNATVGVLSRAEIASAQLVYGANDWPMAYGGALFASNGFRTASGWLVGDAGTVEPQWRYDGLLDTMFQSPNWFGFLGSSGGSTVRGVETMTDDAGGLVYLLYMDFLGRQRLAFEYVERSAPQHAAIAGRLTQLAWL